MKVSDILCDESKWTKNALARDNRGDNVDIHDSTATCYCILGAIGKTRHFYSYTDSIWEAVRSIYGDKYKNLVEFNDSEDTTFEDIKKVLEKAGL